MSAAFPSDDDDDDAPLRGAPEAAERAGPRATPCRPEMVPGGAA
jgi:hypothetical protein